MTDVISRTQITDGLIEMILSSTNRPCGDHRSPADGVLVDGYSYVYSIAGGSFDGPLLTSPEADATLVYQVTSVGATRAHAEWLAERVRLTLTSRNSLGGFQVAFPVLAGVLVTNRSPDGSSPGVISQGPPENRVYSVPERYRISVVSTQPH